MNTTLLKKCLEELSADHPRLDYMKGILETLIELSGNPLPTNPIVIARNDTPKIETIIPPTEPDSYVTRAGNVAGLR